MLLSLTKKLVKYFMFIYLIIYIVQRKNVKEFDYKQTAIQSGILMVVLVIANYFIDFMLSDDEHFEMSDVADTTVDAVKELQEASLKTLEYAEDNKNNLEYNQFEENDFNKNFDMYVARNPLERGFDKCGPQHEPQYIRENGHMDYNTRYEHYNTNVGYTYMDPKTFRIGEQAQPPICLTTQACATQPVIINTSLGKEFLPYSFIEANTQAEDKKRVKNKCKMDTVYNA